MRLTLEATLINGDTASNPRAFDGLSKRLPPGNPMAFNNAGKPAAGAPLSFDHLDELIDSVNAHGGSKVLVMSKAMRRQLNALARATIGGGIYQTSTNAFGMTVNRDTLEKLGRFLLRGLRIGASTVSIVELLLNDWTGGISARVAWLVFLQVERRLPPLKAEPGD